MNTNKWDHLSIKTIDGEKKYGFKDRMGRWVIDPVFDELDDEFHDDGLHRAKINGKWGYINETGSWIIPPEFEQFSDCPFFDEEGIISAKQQGKWGFIDKQGNWRIPPKFEFLTDCFDKNNYCAAKFEGKWGFINRKGAWIIEPEFEGLLAGGGLEIYDWANMVAVKFNGKWGWIDRKGRWVIKPEFEKVDGYFTGDHCPASKNGTPGYVDRKGRWSTEKPEEENKVIKPAAKKSTVRIRKSKVEPFAKTRAFKKPKDEIIDLPGFDWIGIFKGEYPAPAEKGGKWGLINRKGEWVTQLFDYIDKSDEWDYMKVKLNGKFGFIDASNGQWIMEPEFEEIQDFRYWEKAPVTDHAPAKKEGKWGYIDRKCKWLIEPQFDSVEIFLPGKEYTNAKLNGVWGYINRKGEWEPMD